jgi:diacylglycerol kinase family enzyme
MYLQAIVQSQLSGADTCFRLTMDGETIEREGSAFMLMNMSHIGAFRFQITHDIRPDDGLLDVIVVRNEFRALASAAVASLFDDVDFEDVFEHFQAEKIEIETDDELTVLADGENFGTTPATVKVDPATLKLFVPQVEIDVFEDGQTTPG